MSMFPTVMLITRLFMINKRKYLGFKWIHFDITIQWNIMSATAKDLESYKITW